MCPRIPEDRPGGIVIQRGELEVTVADRTIRRPADLSWVDTAALELQHRRLSIHCRDKDEVLELSPAHVRALVDVLRVFPGATVEDWSGHESVTAPTPAAVKAPPTKRQWTPGRRSRTRRVG